MITNINMIKKIRYIYIYLLLLPNIIYAQDFLGMSELEGIDLGKEKDPTVVVSSIINVVLSLLGTIAVVIILLGGFKWMTSQGNADKVTEAKDLIKNGIIGLVIIFFAYSIAKFVINNLSDVNTGAGGDAGANG